MNLNELLKYGFAKEFVEGRLNEDVFLAELFKKVNVDENFRAKTGIISLETGALKEVVDTLKSHSKRTHPTRRGFLGLFGGSIIATALPSINDNKTKEYLNARVLFNEILKISKLTPATMPVASPNPHTSTIIFIEDIHGGEDEKTGWKVEFERLESLRKTFGFNFVGLEGWAGSEVDKRRGRQILNAEIKLIENLINNKDYNVVGLEDAAAQFQMYDVIIAENFKYMSLVLKVIQESLFNNLKVPPQTVNDFIGCINNIAYQKIFISGHSLDINDYKTNVPLNNCINKFLDKIIFNLAKGNEKAYHEFKLDFIKILDRYIEGCIELRFWIEYVYGIVISDDKKFRKQENEYKRKFSWLFKYDGLTHKSAPEYKYIIFTQREQFAVKKILNEIRKDVKKIRVIVFGKNHIAGLIKEFIKQAGQNINIIVLQ